MAYQGGYEKSAHPYDLFDTKENIEFFYHYASESKEILDIGAGTGRIAIPLAERGIKVFCVEPSPAMRKEFEKKLSKRPELSKNIILIEGDASSFKFNRTFPAAFLSGSFDHFLDDNQRIVSLLNIHRHLTPNGKLIFDSFIGLMKNSPLSPAGEVRIDNKEYRRFVRSKLLPDGKGETMLIFETSESGKLIDRIEERSLVGIINRDGIHNILKESGFEIEDEYSNYDFKPFQKGNEILIIEALKR